MSFKKSCGDLWELFAITIKCFNKFYEDVCKAFFEELAKVTIDRIRKDVILVFTRIFISFKHIFYYIAFFFLSSFDFNSDTVMVSECSNRILADILLSCT